MYLSEAKQLKAKMKQKKMKDAIIALSAIVACLCSWLITCIIWSYPFGVKKLLPFECLKEEYPGPEEISISVFPFAIYCDNLFNSKVYQDIFGIFGDYHYDPAPDAEVIYYNSDTLFIKCNKIVDTDSSAFRYNIRPYWFRIVNPIGENDSKSIQERITLVNDPPTRRDLLRRGYKERKVNYLKGLCGEIGAYLLLLLLPIPALLLLILSCIYLLKNIMLSGMKF